MAQRVEVLLVDDLDGSEAAETVVFALDGTSYEIDLSEKNANKLRGQLEKFVSSARRTGGRRAKRNSKEPTPQEIREWAREHGWEVPDRGRVSAEVREAYEAAH